MISAITDERTGAASPSQIDITAADACRGVIHSLRNHLTAVSGMADLFYELASSAGATTEQGRFLQESARKNRAVVGRMLIELEPFLDGPFSYTPGRRPAGEVSVNDLLATMEHLFSASASWAAAGRSTTIAKLADDIALSIPPALLLNALRHFIEFCQPSCGGVVHLSTSVRTYRPWATEGFTTPMCAINRGGLVECYQYAIFAVQCRPGKLTPGDIRDGCEKTPTNPKVGNLMVLSQTLLAEHGAAFFRTGADGRGVFEVLFPVA
jgi:hypothetical protein